MTPGPSDTQGLTPTETPYAAHAQPQSSQGGKHGPSQGKGPLGTWLVIAVLTLTIMMMWFLVLGIMEARV